MALSLFFEAKRRTDPKNGALFFRDLFWSLSILLIMIVVLVEAFIFPLYYFKVFSSGVNDKLLLLMIQMPGLLFISLFWFIDGPFAM